MLFIIKHILGSIVLQNSCAGQGEVCREGIVCLALPDKRVRARMPTKREALNDGNGAQMHKKETRIAVRPEKNY